MNPLVVMAVRRPRAAVGAETLGGSLGLWMDNLSSKLEILVGVFWGELLAVVVVMIHLKLSLKMNAFELYCCELTSERCGYKGGPRWNEEEF